MDDKALAAIQERDRRWELRSAKVRRQAEIDRHALLEHVAELENRLDACAPVTLEGSAPTTLSKTPDDPG